MLVEDVPRSEFLVWTNVAHVQLELVILALVLLYQRMVEQFTTPVAHDLKQRRGESFFSVATLKCLTRTYLPDC